MIKEEEGLKRHIGTWGLTANIINTIIGAGIFVLPALVSEGLGAAGVLAYLFCGFLITIILLCFAEMGSKLTKTGGAYVYIEEAFGRYAGFITTNLFIFGASLLATAAVANAVADTLSFVMPIFQVSYVKNIFFIILFICLGVVNVIGVQQGVTLVKTVTIIKLTPLVLLLCIGLPKIEVHNLSWTGMPTAAKFGKISLLLFFAFQGAENSLSISGEIKDPAKTIPKSILISTGIVLIIYLAIQFVAQGILGNSLAGFKGAPLAETAQVLLGPAGKIIMILGAAISMFGYLCSDILNMPRLLFRSSKDNIIPIKSLSKVHPKFATPYVAIISFTVLGCVLSITGGFRQLAILSTSSVLLIYLGVAFATLKTHLKNTGSSTGFKLPFGYLIPVTAIIIIAWFLTNLSIREWISILVFIGFLTFIYVLINYFTRKSGNSKGLNL